MSNAATRVAVVTGASGGLGHDIAVALGSRGHPVALVARSAAPLVATEEQIRAGGGVAVAVPTDVSDAIAVDALRAQVIDQLGAPLIVVNAAGVFGPIQLIKDSNPAEWVATIMIDAVAPYLVTRAFLGGMLDAGWGRIVNLTSAATLHPPGPMNSAYGTAKVALNQFTRHLAAELAGTGVTANVLHLAMSRRRCGRTSATGRWPPVRRPRPTSNGCAGSRRQVATRRARPSMP
jgi:NAD(P)-dependent dehydrogenase (short-subunit alcohol dehydrogenase family)